MRAHSTIEHRFSAHRGVNSSVPAIDKGLLLRRCSGSAAFSFSARLEKKKILGYLH